MKEVVHPISGAVAALSATVLLAFATDSTARPVSWAVPGAAAALVLACVVWLMTRSATDGLAGLLVRPKQRGSGEQNTLTHAGQGNIIHGGHVEHHHYPETTATEVIEEGGLAAEHRAADKRTFEDLTALVDRNVVDFLRDQDFGSAWSDRMSDPLYDYVASRDAIEHQFLDQALEERRARLYKSVETFTHTLAGYSIPMGPGRFYELNEKQWVRNHAPGDETGRRFEGHRRELGELADAIVVAYDELVREAKRRVP